MAIILNRPTLAPGEVNSGNDLTGLETFPRWQAPIATNNATTSGRLYLSYATAYQTRTLTTGRVMTGNTAAAATPTLVRFALYTVASNGDLTLVASTVNDTALLSVTFTMYGKAYSTPYITIPGQRYAFGVLVVSGATMPTLMGPGTIDSSITAAAPRLSAHVPSLSDLPASVAVGSLVNDARFYWMGAN